MISSVKKKSAASQTNARPRGSVIDLFCGAGGLTHGFRLEGYEVVAGIDVDEACRFPYETNNQAPFVRRDVAKLDADYLSSLYAVNQPTILVGCAPCQPFSKYNQKNDDPKWRLVEKFASLICEVKPDIVSMENVPRLLEFKKGQIFKRFKDRLEDAGYTVWHGVVFAPDYGVPQRRSRLVVLASLHGQISLKPGNYKEDDYVTVKDAIGGLPELVAGGVSKRDPLHRASELSRRNLARIRASIPGGSWRNWSNKRLIAACHKEERQDEGRRSWERRHRIQAHQGCGCPHCSSDAQCKNKADNRPRKYKG